jgi:hypothetical protein
LFECQLPLAPLASVAYHAAMAWPSTLDVALKEWQVVCRALESGRQILLLRKGGIFEAKRGFEIKHREFLLFPTYLHQQRGMLKDEALGEMQVRSAEPERVEIRAAGMVTDIVPVESRGQIDTLEDQHIWTAPLIDMRFNYKPKNPLYLLLVRAYRLTEPVTIDNAPAYAGCISWVPLDRPIGLEASTAVLDDPAYEKTRQNILDKMKERIA